MEYFSKAPLNSLESSNVVSISPTIQQWRSLITTARFRWKKLTSQELLETNGRSKKLVGLLRGKYLLSQIEAEVQVVDFLLTSGIQQPFKSIELHCGH